MNPSETFGLVIGINDYANGHTLKGARPDAEYFKDNFLKKALGLRDENIITLFDGEATRQCILDGFKTLDRIIETYCEQSGDKESGNAAETAGHEPGDQSQEPRLRPCMIIFFAGHGARSVKPNGWGDWAPDSTHVEMLCPSDIGMPLESPVDENVQFNAGDVNGQPVDNPRVVEGIPDRTVCWLLNSLSEKWGNNVTLILDCCYSAGMNRGGGMALGAPRSIMDPPILSGKADLFVDWSLITRGQLMDEESGRAIHKYPGFGGKFHESHVLLSACGKGQSARESDGSGVFTNALMKELQKELGSTKRSQQTLTYSTLTTRLSMPEGSDQTPHCEGSNINKLLFTSQGAASDPSFIPCRKTKTKTSDDGPVQWTLTLDAGAAQGISLGERFSIHQHNLAENNPSIGILHAAQVSTVTSILKRREHEKKFDKGNHFYAKRVDWSSNPPKIYCENLAWLDTVFPQNQIIPVKDKADASLILETRGDKIRFLRSDPFLEACQVSRSFNNRTVSTSSTEGIHVVVGGLHHFNSHLHRQGTEFPQVRMELHFLEEIEESITEEQAQQPQNFRIRGENLLVAEPTRLSLPDPDREERPLGVTLYNDGDVSVYPYLFYFDPNDLTISPWYLPPTGAGTGKVDPPLEAHSMFCIGYGNGAASPWSFHFTGGRTKDVGYFKLLLSTSHIKFESLIRETSPFDQRVEEPPSSPLFSPGHISTFDQGAPSRSGTGDASVVATSQIFPWGAKLFTIIQELEPEESR